MKSDHSLTLLFNPIWKNLAHYLAGGESLVLTYAGLTASGYLLPCVPAPIKLGNLVEQSLEEIWVNNELLNYVRKRKALKGSCKICAHSELCGGCRYTAYMAQGDWLGPDDSCPFGPATKTS